MTAVADILALAEHHHCSINVSGSKLRLSAPEKPPAELLNRLAARKFDIIEHLSRVPAEWVRGMAAIESMETPAGWPEEHWRATVQGAAPFINDWGSKAAALGWSTIDLFGCHPVAPYQRLDCRGLALSLAGKQVAALTDCTAAIGHLTYYRRQPAQMAEAIPIWTCGTFNERA